MQVKLEFSARGPSSPAEIVFSQDSIINIPNFSQVAQMFCRVLNAALKTANSLEGPPTDRDFIQLKYDKKRVSFVLDQERLDKAGWKKMLSPQEEKLQRKIAQIKLVKAAAEQNEFFFPSALQRYLENHPKLLNLRFDYFKKYPGQFVILALKDVNMDSIGDISKETAGIELLPMERTNRFIVKLNRNPDPTRVPGHANPNFSRV